MNTILPGTIGVACSKRSDSGEQCEVKKAMKSRGGLGREVREPSLTSSPPSLLFFRAPFYFAPLPTIWTPGTGYHWGFDWFISCEGLNKNSDHDWCFLLLFLIYLLIHSFIYLLFFRFIAKSSSSWLHNKRRRVGWGVFGFVVQSRTRKWVENKDGWLASVAPVNFAF